MRERYLINTVSTSWEEPPRARHQVAFELSKYAKVVFVERNRFGVPNIKISKPQSNIVLITPFFPIDHRLRYRIPIVCELYQHWLFSVLRKKFGKIPIINFDHTASKIHKYFNDVIYYCNDYYIRGYYFNCIKLHLQRSENKVVRNARFCIVTSDFLYLHLLRNNNKVHLIKLGAPTIINRESKKIQESCDKIKVSLVGFIDSTKISVKLIRKIIINPDIQLFIYGPVKREFKNQFKGINNIFIKGPKTGNELYDELLKTDVGIIPYFKNDNNPGRTPNKLWLYLALGLPTVVTNIENIKNWKFEKGTIYKVKDNNNFVNLIRIH